MSIMTTGMHLPRCLRTPRLAGLFSNLKRVHISAKGYCVTRLIAAPFNACHHTCSSNTTLVRNTLFRQFSTDEITSEHFLIHGLRVPVEIPTPLNRFG
jgi:hypothetical protein